MYLAALSSKDSPLISYPLALIKSKKSSYVEADLMQKLNCLLLKLGFQVVAILLRLPFFIFFTTFTTRMMMERYALCIVHHLVSGCGNTTVCSRDICYARCYQQHKI